MYNYWHMSLRRPEMGSPVYLILLRYCFLVIWLSTFLPCLLPTAIGIFLVGIFAHNGMIVIHCEFVGENYFLKSIIEFEYWSMHRVEHAVQQCLKPRILYWSFFPVKFASFDLSLTQHLKKETNKITVFFEFTLFPLMVCSCCPYWAFRAGRTKHIKCVSILVLLFALIPWCAAQVWFHLLFINVMWLLARLFSVGKMLRR